MTNLSKLKKNILALFLAVLLLFSGQLFLPTNFVRADEPAGYTDVLEDLSKDNDFKIEDYPVLTLDDFNTLNNDSNFDNDKEFISVIQIGESSSKNLFIYTYQPVNPYFDLTAMFINMSIGENSKIYENYSLTCVSSNSVFKKYLVNNFVVNNDVCRYYNIVDIERPFNEELDDKISDETITNTKSSPVGQTWCCYFGSNGLIYERSDLTFVEIKPNLTGFVYCANGVTWGSLVGINSGCNAHFIAFDIVNFSVDSIVDATINYKQREFCTTHTMQSGVLPFLGSLFGKNTDSTVTSYPNGEEYEDISLELNNVDKVSNNGFGLFAKKYTWNRIMTASSFKDSFVNQGVQFSDDTITILDNSQFVFAFTETAVSSSTVNTNNPDSNVNWNSSTTTTLKGTEIQSVDVLRIKFLVGSKTYNLGVVGDKTSGDNISDGVGSGLDFNILNDSISKVIALIAVVLICVIIGPFISPIITVVFQFLGKIFGWLFRNIWKILTFPLRLFKRKSIPKTRKRKQ